MAKHVITKSYTHLPTSEVFTVSVEFDLDSIAQRLAARAFESKTGKSVLVNGDIVCQVTERRTTPAAVFLGPAMTDIDTARLPVTLIGRIWRRDKRKVHPSDIPTCFGRVLMRGLQFQCAPVVGEPVWNDNARAFDSLRAVEEYESLSFGQALVQLADIVLTACNMHDELNADAAGLTLDQVRRIKDTRNRETVGTRIGTWTAGE